MLRVSTGHATACCQCLTTVSTILLHGNSGTGARVWNTV